LRDVPGKSVQRSWQTQWFRWLRQRPTGLYAPSCEVVRIPRAPGCLGLLAARRLAFRMATGPLPFSNSRVRPEPPATDGTRSLPDVRHK
jgi:hypothetical protein